MTTEKYIQRCPKCNNEIDVDTLTVEFMYEDITCPHCKHIIDVGYDEVEIDGAMVPVYDLKIKACPKN